MQNKALSASRRHHNDTSSLSEILESRQHSGAPTCGSAKTIGADKFRCGEIEFSSQRKIPPDPPPTAASFIFEIRFTTIVMRFHCSNRLESHRYLHPRRTDQKELVSVRKIGVGSRPTTFFQDRSVIEIMCTNVLWFIESKAIAGIGSDSLRIGFVVLNEGLMVVIHYER